MKLALMQPYFIPYLGYYSLMKHVDVYYYLDEVQYINQGWIDRNRILKPDDGWQYIRVPLGRHSSKAKIKELKINNSISWKKKILNQLEHYKKFAPYYNEAINILRRAFEYDFEYLTDFIYSMDYEVCKYLNITTERKILSKSKIEYLLPQAPDEWGLNVCKSIEGVNEYWNAIGGKQFFSAEKYDIDGIGLHFLNQNLKEYKQKTCEFISGLSIIDVIMFNSAEEIEKMLDDFILE